METTERSNAPDPATVSYRDLAIRYGAIWGGVSIVSSLIGFLTNTNSTLPDAGPVKWVYTIVGLGVASWAIATVIRIDRDEQLGGYIGLGRCLGIGSLEGLVSGILNGIFTAIYMTVINPGFSEQLKEMMVAQWEEQGMGEDQIEMALSMSSAFTNPVVLSVSQVIGGVILGLIIGLVAGLVMKRERSYI